MNPEWKGRGLKRRPQCPALGRSIIEDVSKAELLEVAWSLAALCNEAGSADDDASTFKRLVEEVNTLRINRGARPLKVTT